MTAPGLLLLALMASSAIASPLQDTLSNRLLPREDDALPVSPETATVALHDDARAPRKHLPKTIDARPSKSSQILLPALSPGDKQDTKTSIVHPEKHHRDTKEKTLKKGRKHKAIFVNYPLLPQIQFPNLPTYDADYSNDYDSGVEQRTPGGSKRYQESNIFYIRLPPTPYMFVPGLGYISQPPTYSTANLRPQISYARPGRPKPVYQKPVNPFIKLPIDFVSNGKPTSVYQWQKKPSKKPADSPITNLDNLSADFVSNGKPTTIYQWQANLKPAKRPDDLVNNLDKGPYTFNGKPTSFFLLKPDGTSSGHQSIRYPDYQEDNSYY